VKPPYTIDANFFARGDFAVAQALTNHLAVVLNMHNYDELVANPAAHHERFLALWKQIAERYHALPNSVAFELLNEPHGKLDATNWNEIAAATLKEVRTTNPQRIVVIGPTQWNAVEKIETLQLPEDDRQLLATVHYYLPFHFTHQGASWAGAESRKWLGTKWTGSEEETGDIRRDFDKAAAWGKAHNRPVYLGEFGAYSKADMDSRARWTLFVREEATARGFGTAYWEFSSGFGAYDPKAHAWREPLLKALLGK
jgi:endoglucanase